MNIHLHIERLTIEDPRIASERSVFLSSFQAELSRLLLTRGLSDRVKAAGVVDYVDAGAVRLARDAGPKRHGVEIAGALHRRLGRTQPTTAGEDPR